MQIRFCLKCNYNSDESKIYPTIIDEPNINSEVMQSEIFGPILLIFSFEKVSEIDKIILSNPDPLALYVFSDDKEFSENIIRRYRFGGGVVNDTIIHLTNPNLPFGGIEIVVMDLITVNPALICLLIKNL